MKKNIFYSLIFSGVLAIVSAEAVGQGIDIKSRITPVNRPVSTAQSVENLNLESPFRCDVKDYGDIEVMSTLFLKPDDFVLKQIEIIDALPRFEVNGFSFGTMPIDEALQLLLKEAGIKVFAQDRVYPQLNASDLYGELEPVVAELTRAGDVFYKYDATAKRLTVSKRAQFELSLPQNRTVVFAVLDALRGAGIKTAVPNWKKHSIVLTLSRSEEEKVNSLMEQILTEGKLLIADTKVYALSPAKADWQDVVTRFGAGRIYTASNGMVGKILTTGHKSKAEDLLAMLPPNFKASLLSEGIAIVPHGWKMRFDVGRCARQENKVSSLSVLLNAQIKDPQKTEVTVSLDTTAGDISTFNVWSAVDEELAVIGIPGSVAGLGIDGELFITLKLRFIRLVSEGK